MRVGRAAEAFGWTSAATHPPGSNGRSPAAGRTGQEGRETGNPIGRSRRTTSVTHDDGAALDTENTGRLIAEGLAACYVWYRVLAAQDDRLAESCFVPDGYVFVIGLRNLRRAAALVASTLTRAEDRYAAGTALAEFDRVLPGAQRARAALEQIDDYGGGGGTGRDDRPASCPSAVIVRSAGVGRRRVTLYVGEFAVPVADATAAACLLLAEMHAVAHADPADVPQAADGGRDAGTRVVPVPPALAA